MSKRIPSHRKWQLEEANHKNYKDLNDEEKQWLEAFNRQEICADFSEENQEALDYDLTQEEKKKINSRDYSQRSDLLNTTPSSLAEYYSTTDENTEKKRGKRAFTKYLEYLESRKMMEKIREE